MLEFLNKTSRKAGSQTDRQRVPHWMIDCDSMLSSKGAGFEAFLTYEKETKPYVCFLILCLVAILVNSSCKLGGGQTSDSTKVTLTEGKDGEDSVECSTRPACQLKCKTVFETSKDLYDKCLEEKSDDVIELDRAISAMEKGSWKSIKPGALKVLVDFDEDLWPKYAGVRDKDIVQDMLLWVAENPDVSEHVYQEVLKKAFTVLGQPASEDEVVREGMTKDVDIKEKRTFFEVSAFKKNQSAFESAHELLVQECNEDPYCIRKFYCALNKTLVFGKLNSWDLAESAQQSGSLNQSDCD